MCDPFALVVMSLYLTPAMQCRFAFTFGLVASLVAATATALAQPSPRITPPVVVERADAVFAASALGDRAQADVVLIVTVGADGRVSDTAVADSGGADLDEAAAAAARRWTFVPATRDGTPVASRITIPFHFGRLTTVAVAPAPAPAPAVVPAPAPAPAPEEVNVRGRAAPPNVGASDFNVAVGALAN